MNLSLSKIMIQAIGMGLKNTLSIIGALILWLLTIWIPYLNVGTTIALSSMPLGLAKGNVMSPLEIFNGDYRRYMGEYFILLGLKAQGILPGLLFVVIPGIVIALAWSLALPIMIDKGVGPSEALQASNKITYGHKWKMFFAKVLLPYVYLGIFVLLALMFQEDIPVLAGLIFLIGILSFFPVLLSVNAVIYRELVLKQITEI